MHGIQFTALGQSPGTQTDSATVTFGRDSVTVDGTIWGRNSGRTAELTDVSHDIQAGEVTVGITTTDREDTGDMFMQGIVEISYEVVIEFDGDLPNDVVVTHDHGDGPQEVKVTSSD